MNIQICITMLRKKYTCWYLHLNLHTYIKSKQNPVIDPEYGWVAPGTTATPFGKPSRKQPAKAQENRPANSPKMRGSFPKTTILSAFF